MAGGVSETHIFFHLRSESEILQRKKNISAGRYMTVDTTEINNGNNKVWKGVAVERISSGKPFALCVWVLGGGVIKTSTRWTTAVALWAWMYPDRDQTQKGLPSPLPPKPTAIPHDPLTHHTAACPPLHFTHTHTHWTSRTGKNKTSFPVLLIRPIIFETLRTLTIRWHLPYIDDNKQRG